MVGANFLVIIIVSTDGVQMPFEIVQIKVLAPFPKPVIPLFASPGLVMVPVPLIKIQVPVPELGVFPARVAVVAQTSWSGPAFEVVTLPD